MPERAAQHLFRNRCFPRPAVADRGQCRAIAAAQSAAAPVSAVSPSSDTVERSALSTTYILVDVEVLALILLLVVFGDAGDDEDLPVTP